MNIILYMPVNEAFAAVREDVVKAFPGMKVVDASETAAEGVAEAAASAGKAGILVLHPPVSEESARNLDNALKARLGKRGLPRAVFFAPAPGKAGADAYAEYREKARPVYRHYAKDRRAREFRKPAAKAAAGAVRAARKRVSVVRWWAAVPAVLLVAAAAVAGLQYRDALVRSVVVEEAQAVFKARTDIFGLSTTLTPEIRIEKGAVADRKKPMENLFEFQSLRGGIDAAALAKGRLVIPALAVEGLRFHTPRAESGALPAAGPAPEEPPAPPKADTSGTDFSRNVEAVLDRLAETFAPPKVEDLQTPKAAKALAEESRRRWEKLAADVKALDLQGRFARNREALEGLFKRPPPASLEKVREDLKGLKGLKFGPRDFESIQAALAGAAGVDLAQEKKNLETARADLEAVKKSMEACAKAIQKAKGVQKVTILDVPSVVSLLDEIGKVYEALSTTKKKLEAATATLDGARRSLEEKKAKAEGFLKTGNLDIGKATEALDQGGTQALESFAVLKKDVEAAWADLEKERRFVMELLASLEKELLELKAAGEKLEKQLEDDAKYLLSQVDVMQAALEADRKMLEERYSLEKLDAEALLKTLLGESLAGWVEFGYRAYVTLEPYATKVIQAQPKKKKLGRGKGTSYSFPAPDPEGPAVWVRELTFSGVVPIQGRDFDLSGRIRDLTSDPKLAGKEVRLEFKASKDGRTIEGEVRFFPGGGMAARLALSGFPVSGIGFKSRYAPRDIRARELRASVEAAFQGKTVTARAEVRLEGLAFETDFTGVERHVAGALARVYGGIDSVGARAEIGFAWPSVSSFRVESDLAAKVEASFRDALSASIEEAKKEALQWLEEKTGAPVADARSAVEAYRKDGSVQVGPLVKDAAALIDRATGGQTGLSGKFAEYEAFLKIPDDPSQAAALARQQLGRLQKELDDRGVKFNGDYADRAALVDAVAKMLTEQQSGPATNEKDLKAEIDRLTAMLKKVKKF